MSILSWVAIAVIILAVVGLVKRLETRMVLIAAGLFLCAVSMDPMSGLKAFEKSMTKASLIAAICSSMGFAFVAGYTKCDRGLVHYLASPIRGLGIFLIPICTALTFFINIAIPSAAGCAAAVGSTLIPVMLRAGIRPAAAAAAVLAGTIGSYLSPGTSHNSMVANMANIEVMDFIKFHAPFSFMCGAVVMIGLLIVCFIMRDHKTGTEARDMSMQSKEEDVAFKPNPLMAIVPLVPIVLLLLGNTVVPALKMGVAPAMVIGALVALVITWTNPSTITKEFFNGMGKSYADVMGIIIAAGVFAAGLKSAGLIDALVHLLKESNEIARWGASIGPWAMGVITGSGDAATLAFNETVTPHAKEFGMTIEGLGGIAFLSGALGRTMSPLAGAAIVVSGIAMVDPIQVIKRTAIPCIVAVILCALLMV